jgi:hypothetical protein
MRKYRTKAGTVEEKLQGVNATVNPSEKAQIAMAGGADTLKDVQTILGQEGKRNFLKNQGAKHIVSFYMGEGGYMGSDDISDSGFAPSDIGDSYSPPAAPDFGYGGEPGGVAEPENQLGRPPGGVAQSGFAPIEYPTRQHLPSYKKAGNETYFQDEEFWEDKEQTDWEKANPNPSLFDKAKREVGKVTSFYNIPNLQKTAAASGVVNLAVGNLPGAFIDFANLAYQTSRKSTAKFDQSPIPGLTSKAAEEYADLYTSPPPDDPYSGGDDAPKKKKKKKKPISYADNKVTLDVKSPTRAQKRYRGGWRTV